MKLAMVFPGQGSQAVGMLKGFEGLPGIAETRSEAVQALGADFVTLMDEGPSEALNQTINTQPAMLTAGVAAYRAWCALGGMAPAVVAGHSLGEYSALVAAGALSFATCLPLVRFRALAMQQAVPQGEGAMAAILGLDDAGVREACKEAAGAVQAVNFNAPSQLVIAGEARAVERAMQLCKSRGAKRVMPLPVSAPFHSTLMQPAAEKLKSYLDTVSIAVPGTPMINNVDVQIESDPGRVRDALVRQAASPVRWVETIRKMQVEGVTHIVESGPGRVLAGLTRRIAPELKSFALSDRAALENALKELAHA